MRPEPDLARAFDPRAVEPRIYARWEADGLFHAEVDPARRPYCIVMPPPNVTGDLHLGHALDTVIQDVLVRWRRMEGDAVLWQPGTDHAGIATQAVVERRLLAEGRSRHDLGRERFLERVWAWKDEYESHILDQLRRMGASADWSRTRFTMDEGLSRAVVEVFVRYHEEGLLYRDDAVVHWCPDCRTALSDLEVEHWEEDGALWTIRYPLEGGGEIRVATTRPETMLGDTAVAVHPDDPRYRSLAGRTAILPLVGRRLPVVADPAVEREFGTGAVKVTPGHDPLDFEIGRRHGLEAIQVVGWDGRMTDAAGEPYKGLRREEARRRVLADLAAQGLLVSEAAHRHAVGHCSRCDAVIEPLVSRQWFLRMRPLAEPAIRAVREGRLRIVPRRFTKIYLHWLENIRDWCVSRQIWWGHRIPAYECEVCGETTVARSRPERCPRCGAEGTRLRQDEDVLDTWFSSALWPFSTLGWPDDTAELRFFYPTSTLVTGYDILFFWVARMAMSGLHFMGEVPFRTVLLHGLVRDAEGRKMSKSRGNTLDPVELVDEYGADALRWALVHGTAMGGDVNVGRERLEAGRNFANKIWNAGRFALSQLGASPPGRREEAWLRAGLPDDRVPPGFAPADLVDRFCLDRLAAHAAEVRRHLRRFELGEALAVAYAFVWDEFCDWYLEASKHRLYGHEGEEARATARLVLWGAFGTVLRLLHPFLPFVTEELWSRLPGARGSVMQAAYPRPPRAWRDPEAESDMRLAIELVRTVRALRGEVGVEPGRPVRVVLVPGELRPGVARGAHLLRLARVESWELAARAPAEPAVAQVVRGVGVYLPLQGQVDVEREAARLEAERRAVEERRRRLAERLARPGYQEKAPAEVVARDRAALAELERVLAGLAERAARLGRGPQE
ncbi:MAG: valine--tRNA ligase [Clostridia bacterium]|nr:valine--tRNA ligase [Clostridia bacterium]